MKVERGENRIDEGDKIGKMRDQEKEEKKLIKGLLTGSNRALSQFQKEYAVRLRRFVAGRMGEVADVEEVVQDSLISALDSLALFSGRSALFTWLCGIAKHEIADFYRRKKIKAVVFSRIPLLERFVSRALEPEAALLRKEYEKQVRKALGLILPQYKKVLEFKYMDNLSVAEISEKMGLSFKACESMLARARQAFELAYEK